MPSRSSTRLGRRIAGAAVLGTLVAARATRRRGARRDAQEAPAVPAPPVAPLAVVTPPDTGPIQVQRLTPPAPEVAPVPRRAAEDAAIAEAIGRGIRDADAIAAHVVAVTERQRSSSALRRRIEDALGATAS
jgi:hypothetical protein